MITETFRAIVTVARQRALRETRVVDIADDADEILVLALVLAIDSIQNQRR